MGGLPKLTRRRPFTLALALALTLTLTLTLTHPTPPPPAAQGRTGLRTGGAGPARTARAAPYRAPGCLLLRAMLTTSRADTQAGVSASSSEAHATT